MVIYITNIIRTSTPEFAEKLKDLKLNYYLKDKSAKSRTAITLSRVCMVFPVLSCSYMTYCRNLTVSKMHMLSLCPGYPTEMMTSAYASVIPRDKPYTQDLKCAYLVHQVEFISIIMRKIYSKKAPDMQTVLLDLDRSVDAAINGELISNADREEYQLNWGILVVTPVGLTLSPEARVAADYWKSKHAPLLRF